MGDLKVVFERVSEKVVKEGLVRLLVEMKVS